MPTTGSRSSPSTSSSSMNSQPILHSPPRLAGIVLAAGRASRFGSDKRLVPYNHDYTLLGRSIALIEGFCSQVFVVTRPGDEALDLLSAFRNDAHIEQHIAPDAVRGMGASLASGIARVAAYEEEHHQLFDGVLIMLADMPFVQEATITTIVEGFLPDKIIIPSYLQAHKEKKWGNPVLFSRKWFAALHGLNGDRGARALIKANPCARVEMVVEDAGILRDIDTPGDLDTPDELTQ